MTHQNPKHIAIVMDGNGRWAQKKHLPRAAGHRAGLQTARKIVAYCAEQEGIEALTLFAFSSENWKRPADEVGLLMDLFSNALTKELDLLLKNDVSLRILGDREALSPSLQKSIHRVEQLTENGKRMRLNIALNYGGRWDIVQAMQLIAQHIAEGHLSSDQINESLVSQLMSTGTLPEPDLFIRTSGELRLSNFMLWQCAYSELYFTDVLWPDFTEQDLARAIQDYQQRQRRYGDISVVHSKIVAT